MAVYHSKPTQYEKLQFDGRTDGILKIKLPSGRDMIFQKPYIGTGRFGGSVVKVMGTEATTKRYIEIDLYPSKLFQNIVQAIARDVLVNAMEQITDGGFQESCRLKLKSYAATSFCFSGLRNTSSTLSQFRISPLQRSGCRDFAC